MRQITSYISFSRHSYCILSSFILFAVDLYLCVWGFLWQVGDKGGRGDLCRWEFGMNKWSSRKTKMVAELESDLCCKHMLTSVCMLYLVDDSVQAEQHLLGGACGWVYTDRGCLWKSSWPKSTSAARRCSMTPSRMLDWNSFCWVLVERSGEACAENTHRKQFKQVDSLIYKH